MIVEGLVTTLGADGAAHVAPMGPEVEGDFRRIVLKPFTSAQTFRNLRSHPEGVFHLVDDVGLLARAAIGPVSPAVRPAARVRGFILEEACRYFEFRAVRIDASGERSRIECEVAASGTLREFSGFNRARHAVLEAAILATRAGFLPIDALRAQVAQLAPPVAKTGGPVEREAFEILREHIEKLAREREAAGTSGAGGTGPAAVRVRTASRLHFGLIAPGEGAPRRFGSVGAMVERPGIELMARRAKEYGGTGPMAERAMDLARRVDPDGKPVRIDVSAAPPEHAGLGTGTQLGMAVARAVAELRGERGVNAAELARRAGRGERSGIGLHGFLEGGLLVDGGRGGADRGIPPLIARVEIPRAWRFLLLLPGISKIGAAISPGLSGAAEREAFARLESAPRLAAEISRAVLLGLLPAAHEGDIESFGEALYEIGRRAGECFAAVQGGIYGSRRSEEVIEFLRGEGIAGAGQSSWGPALYAAVESDERAQDAARRVAEHFPGMEVIVTPPANTGATVEAVPG